MRKHMFLAAMLGLLMTPIHAQERAAGNALETQMTWSSLKNMVESANAYSKVAHTRIDNVDACAKKGFVYVSGTGCEYSATPPQVLKDINDNALNIKYVMDCGDKGMVYDRSGKSCVRPPKTLAKIDYSKCMWAENQHNETDKAGEMWGTTIKTGWAAYLACPTNYAMVGVNTKDVDAAFCCRIEQQ